MNQLTRTLSTFTATVALCLTGCGDAKSSPAPPSRDLGTDGAEDGGPVDGDVLDDADLPLADGAVPFDGAVPLDGAVFFDGAGPLDGAVFFDGAVPIDAGEAPDAAPTDAGSAVDAEYPDFGAPVACLDDAGAYDACRCAPRAVACSGTGDPACPAGTTCLDTGCGGTACLRGGATCVDDSDCPTGSTCTSVSPTERVCARSDATCVDSRDCAAGYACEGSGAARACVNRRISCTYLDACPYGFNCRTEAGIEPFCERVYVRCTNATACPGRRCIDVDGDGLSECGYGGCTASSSCTAGTQCAFDPPHITMACGPHGVCHSPADCGAGEVCLDVWGDGVLQCEAAGSTCAAGTCPAGQLCGASVSGGVAQCRATP